MTKRIILCADDYGQNPSISQAIIDLIAKNRLSATSCMVNSDYWPEHAKWLQPYFGKTHIGLHINFTEGKPLSTLFQQIYGQELLPLPKLLMDSVLRKIDKKAIAAEMNEQLDKFLMETNQLPDFLDGHQHVHHFPVIRDVLLEVYQRRLKNVGTYIRNVNDPHAWQRIDSAYFKRMVIQLSGASTLQFEMRTRNIPHNTSFSGIYDFSQTNNVAKKFQQFLKQIQNGGLIMCHPGLQLSTEAITDPIYAARHHEYEYFLSDQFLRDCVSQHVDISPVCIEG
jgi:predicted glycoside hydrolase/deacetylase ChbG (UPF0249 family)